MNKKCEIFEIYNGYLIKDGEAHIAYQWDSNNNQLIQMHQDIIDKLHGKSKYKIVSAEDAAKLYAGVKT